MGLGDIELRPFHLWLLWGFIVCHAILPAMSEQDIREPLSDEQAEQIERGLRRLLSTPPKPHGPNPTTPPPPKVKGRAASKGRVNRGKTGR